MRKGTLFCVLAILCKKFPLYIAGPDGATTKRESQSSKSTKYGMMISVVLLGGGGGVYMAGLN